MTERSSVLRFNAGELSPAFYGATDLEKYGIGIAKGLNAIQDFKGGLKNRTGFEFMDFTFNNVKPVPFLTDGESPDILLIFSFNTIEFMIEGQYLLDSAALAVTAVDGNELTIGTHTFIQGSHVYLENTTLPDGRYLVTNISLTTITVALVTGVVPNNVGTFTAGTVRRFLTITTPYSTTDLRTLRVKQRQNSLFLYSVNHAPRRLTLSDGVWSLAVVNASGVLSNVADFVANASGSGSAITNYLVVPIDAEGRENGRSRPRRLSGIVNFTTTAGSVSLSWSPVAGAVAYRVYRSIVTENADITNAAEMGFIGETPVPSFIDANIIPDFTRQPYSYVDPFATGSILKVNVTAGGTGFGPNETPFISAVGSGSGFTAYGVIKGGALYDVVITEGGRGYDNSTTFEVSPLSSGTGATIVLGELSPASGVFPAIGETFQQRVVFGGSLAFPMTLWGTMTGTSDRFNFNTTPVPSDAFSLSIDADEITPIRHLMRQADGLLVMHSRGVDKLTASTGQAVGPTNNSARSEVAIGVGIQPPLSINNDVVFVTDAGTSVISLAYTFYSNSYAPQELSVLSGHLFSETNQPVSLTWHQEPDKLIWMPLENGTALTLTYLPAQETFAWTRHDTQGFFRDFVVVRENRNSRLYAVVDRWLNGRLVTSIERQAQRDTRLVENFFGVDCGLRTDNRVLASEQLIRYEEDGDDKFIRSIVETFASVQPGDIVFVFGGRYRVLETVSTTSLRVEIDRPPTGQVPYTDILPPTRDWYIARPSATVGGLWHLEGETVSVLADGDAVLGLVVENGQIELQQAAAIISVGLPYVFDCIGLPLATYAQVEGNGRRKRPTSIALRLQDTRGLEYGMLNGPLYEMKDRGFENYGEVTQLRSGVSLLSLGALFEQDSQFRFRQRYPLPATILGYTAETEVEDA